MTAAHTTPTRRAVGRPARHTPEQLLALVVAQFNARGYDATSMADLAHATGMTKSSLYHHVSGKEELLRLGVARGLDELFAVLDEPASTSGRAVNRLEHVVHRSVEVLVAELPYVTLLLRVRGNTGAERWALERRREFDARLSTLVLQAVEQGELRADLDPRLVTRLLFGTVNSIVDWYRPDARHDVGDVADTVVALVLQGLRPRR